MHVIEIESGTLLTVNHMVDWLYAGPFADDRKERAQIIPGVYTYVDTHKLLVDWYTVLAPDGTLCHGCHDWFSVYPLDA